MSPLRRRSLIGVATVLVLALIFYTLGGFGYALIAQQSALRALERIAGNSCPSGSVAWIARAVTSVQLVAPNGASGEVTVEERCVHEQSIDVYYVFPAPGKVDVICAEIYQRLNSMPGYQVQRDSPRDGICSIWAEGPTIPGVDVPPVNIDVQGTEAGRFEIWSEFAD